MAGEYEPSRAHEHEHNRTPGADAADDKESRKKQQLDSNAYDLVHSLVSGDTIATRTAT
jgi:hypothetical protein